MADPVLDFWFDFASTYSYLAAARIRPLAAAASVRVRFRPFLLGPIFKAQGWDTSPFNLYRGEGPLHVARHGAACRRPRAAVPPSRSVSAEQPAAGACGAVRAGARLGRGLFRRRLLRAVRRGRPDRRAAHARRNPVLHECRRATPHSKRRNRTKSSFACGQRSKQRRCSAFSVRRASPPRDGELFWGNDRLEQALPGPTRRTG